MTFAHTGNALNNANNASPQVTHGLTINNKDLVVAYVHTNGTSTVTADSDSGSGWNKVIDETISGQTSRHTLWWREANASEPSTYEWSFTSDNWRVLLMVFTSASFPVVDAAAVSMTDATNQSYIEVEAIDGEVISDNAVSIVFGGKDTRGSTEPYTDADNSFVSAFGDAPNQVSAGAHRIYTTGETFSGNVRIDVADNVDAFNDITYSVHFSFIEDPVQMEQEGFRFRNDDGSESAATFRQLQDVDDTVGKETNIRLRVLSDATGDPPTKTATLQFKRDTDPTTEWRDV